MKTTTRKSNQLEAELKEGIALSLWTVVDKHNPARRREAFDVLKDAMPVDPENRTGKFFAALAGRTSSKDPKELGREIMRRRNLNYKPEWEERWAGRW